jgi:hypothetical protein
MKVTRHAEKRFQQRGFSDEIIQIILTHGEVLNAPGGATQVVLSNKESQRAIAELKAAIQMVIRAKDKCMIIKDGQIITAYNSISC